MKLESSCQDDKFENFQRNRNNRSGKRFCKELLFSLFVYPPSPRAQLKVKNYKFK